MAPPNSTTRPKQQALKRFNFYPKCLKEYRGPGWATWTEGYQVVSVICKDYKLLCSAKYLTNRSGWAKKSAYISKRDLLSRINVGRTTCKTHIWLLRIEFHEKQISAQQEDIHPLTPTTGPQLCFTKPFPKMLWFRTPRAPPTRCGTPEGSQQFHVLLLHRSLPSLSVTH